MRCWAVPGWAPILSSLPIFRHDAHPVVENATMDLQSEIARISRKQNEVRQFVAETHKQDAVVWPFAIGGIIVGAGLFAAGTAFARIMGA